MRRQEGFSLVEVLVSIVMLALVAGGLAAGMVAANRQIGGARTDNAASTVAQETLDKIAIMEYGDVGLLGGGNPPGTLPPTATLVRGSVNYRVDTNVTYEDDAAGGQPQSFANYKRVTVTVTPQTPNPSPTTVVKLFAPPSAGAVRDKATAIVEVQDSFLAVPIPGASVLVNGSTSPPRTDVTNASGKAFFGLLEPSAPSGPLYDYYFAATKNGYVTHATSVGLKLHLAANQTGSPIIKMFKPAKIIVNATDRATGLPITEFTSVTVKTPNPGSLTEVKQGNFSPYVFTSVAGDPIEPRPSPFEVTVAADCYGSSMQSSPVPVGYPSNTDQIFNFQFDLKPHGNLNVQVVNNSTGAVIPGATVQISGGGPNIAPRARTTDAGGTASYCLEPSGGVRYVVSVTAPNFGAGAALQTITVGNTSTLQVRLAPAGTSCIIVLTARPSGTIVRLQRLSPAFEAIQPTDGTGNQTFPGLAPATDYKASFAVGFDAGGQPIAFSSPLTVSCVAGATRTYVLR